MALPSLASDCDLVSRTSQNQSLLPGNQDMLFGVCQSGLNPWASIYWLTGCMFLVLGWCVNCSHTFLLSPWYSLCSLFCFSPLHTLPSNRTSILFCSRLFISPYWKVIFIRAHIFACFGQYSNSFVQNMQNSINIHWRERMERRCPYFLFFF